ncbi:retropepsin-like aspartic protease [Pseudoalteromonas umbrosa]|uniref:retropepsin-like aspartic protease n=1 Tax=Pseudoalteromonas umbrosa TaxID=3048489 RepID=UPI0024C2ED38|nr:retropepsin-like aspartic protease [Pseudoalteromonas sp. B95]MDK1290392.1 retropepsin-like aspartic protease [Pseudoalteromonas sp. B95]
MRYLLQLLLMCSLFLNVYLEWQRPGSILKGLLRTDNKPPHTILAMNDASMTTPSTSAVSTAINPLALAKQHFNRGDILTAIALWENTPNPLSHIQQVHVWLTQLREKLDRQNTQQLTDILRFVQRILVLKPNDFAALQLEADVYLALDEHNEAIYRYLKLLHLYPEYKQLQDILTQLIAQQLKQLKTESNWHEIITQGQIWLSEQPSNIAIIAAIVEANLALNNTVEAELLLAQLSAQQLKHQAITPLKARLDNATQQVERIPLARHGEHYVLNAKIAGQDIALMIDTGASVTALTVAQFEQLAYDVDYINSRRVSTANGITEVPFYQSSGIQIGTKQKAPFEFGVMEQSHYGPGLLGMNFLRHFDFEIDQHKAELILRPR